jgi:hypothetical protein
MRTTIVLDDDLIEAAGRTHGKARKYFFFEKKKQKTFVFSVYVAEPAAGTSWNKSFLVLFFKKELLFYGLPSFGGKSHSMRDGMGWRARLFRGGCARSSTASSWCF